MGTDDGIHRILYVEDHVDVGAGVQSRLGAELNARKANEPTANEVEVKIDVVRDCQDAIEAVRKSFAEHAPYALFILDMQVPRHFGEPADETFGLYALELFRFLVGNAPLIVYTGHPNYRQCVRSIKLGAEDYIPKTDPITLDDGEPLLAERCRELLKVSERREDPVNRLIGLHSPDLLKKFAGKYVAFIEENIARRVVLPRAEAIGDFVLVVEATLEELMNVLYCSKVLQFWGKPYIIRVPFGEELGDG